MAPWTANPALERGVVSRKRSVRTEVEEGKGRHRARVATDVLRQGQAGTPGGRQCARGEHGWETHPVACHDDSSCPFHA